MAICAVLCGADNWVEVADWCGSSAVAQERFGLRLDRGTPSLTLLATCLAYWTQAYSRRAFGSGSTHWRGWSKAWWRSMGRPCEARATKAAMRCGMVTAYAVQSGLCLAQEGTCGKGTS
ncbi:MAG: hypothetical protein IPI02_20900 [Sterolibacteriaceae bacterium]|nr:hypothetical protein [Sterolibacteriaceae bacterium]